jgi:uncharacterized small protein (DUF1192 family)
LNDAEFRRAVSETRIRAFDAAVGKLASLAAKAVSTLERLMEHGERPVALRAAKTILEIGPRLLAFTELEQRIAALEAEERKRRGNDGQEPSGETDGEGEFPSKVRRGRGAALGRLTARLERLEAQRAERHSSAGDSVGDATDGTIQDSHTEPPSQEVAENGRKSEIRWR